MDKSKRESETTSELPELTNEVIRSATSEYPHSYKIVAGENVLHASICLGFMGVEVTIMDENDVIITVLRDVKSMEHVIKKLEEIIQKGHVDIAEIDDKDLRHQELSILLDENESDKNLGTNEDLDLNSDAVTERVKNRKEAIRTAAEATALKHQIVVGRSGRK